MAIALGLQNNFGTPLGVVRGVLSAELTEVLNGEDTLVIQSTQVLDKGTRVFFNLDDSNTTHYREYIVASTELVHDQSGLICIATCENSIMELKGDFILDKRPTNKTQSAALAEALTGTRWTVGDVSSSATASCRFWRMSSYECVKKIFETWGGELSTTCLGDPKRGVHTRQINSSKRGAYKGRRFVWARNLNSIKRIVEIDDICTALYGYGKGEQSGDGFTNRIDFSSINNGKQYVEDLDALARYGRGSNQGAVHVFGKVEFPDCESQSELLALTKEELKKRSVPKISYEATVAAFKEVGYTFENVELGDEVLLIDKCFDPEIRVKGRVVKIERNLLEDYSQAKLTIGNIAETLIDVLINK